jgi:hypothetical protein
MSVKKDGTKRDPPNTNTLDLSQEGDFVLRKAQEKSPVQTGKLWNR